MRRRLYTPRPRPAFPPLCATVGLADGVTSQNIVGYAQTANQSAQKPIIGGQFFEVSGATTFDLSKYTIPGTKTWNGEEWECQYMNPANEYLRVLDTTSLADTIRYTYIDEAFIIDNDDDLLATPPAQLDAALASYKWAIGWWKRPVSGKAPDYADLIFSGETTTEWKVNGEILLPNSTTFVGNFGKGVSRQLISNGQVKTETFAFSNAGAQKPVFGNQLPVDIDLADMSIPGSKTWNGEEWECQYMNPANEYLRVLDSTSLADTVRYTYIDEAFIIDNDDDLLATPQDQLAAALAPYQWAIGWWKRPVSGKAPDYADLIFSGETTTEWKVNDAVLVKAGYGFIGNFGKGVTRQVNFPSATAVPSKQ